MAANTISGLGKPRDRFRGPGRALPEAPEGDSDETVSKNSAGPSTTHETVSKMSDLRPSGETWVGEAKFLEIGRVPKAL